jgi:hypothetical protein
MCDIPRRDPVTRKSRHHTTLTEKLCDWRGSGTPRCGQETEASANLHVNQRTDNRYVIKYYLIKGINRVLKRPKDFFLNPLTCTEGAEPYVARTPLLIQLLLLPSSVSTPLKEQPLGQ